MTSLTPWPVVYRIDAADQLVHVNDAWTTFARDNGAAALDPSHVLGRVLWTFVSDPTTRYIYKHLVDRVRSGTPTIRFQFRCDAPERRRLLAMGIESADDGGVQFVVNSVVEETRLPMTVGEDDAPHAAALLSACGWCKRLPLPSGAWVEVEDAIAERGLFQGGAEPQMTHGICPDCYAQMMKFIDDPDASEADAVTLGPLPRK